MPVNLQQYRGAVEVFNNRFNHNNINKSVFHRKPVSSIASAYFAMLINLCTLLSVISFCLVVLFRNIEQNPGPKLFNAFRKDVFNLYM